MPQPGAQPVELHLPERAFALAANGGVAPYSLSVDLSDTGQAMSGTVTAGSCRGGSNVKVRVKVSKQALDVLRHVALTDTVTLFVDPE